MEFLPRAKVVDKIDALPLAEVMNKETMFYQSSVGFVLENGGPIVKEFIDKLPFDTDGVIIDQRIHRLQKGFFPCIPGYHIDWVPRKNKGKDLDFSRVPDYEQALLILAQTSLTKFISNEIELTEPYPKTFEELVLLTPFSELSTWSVQSGDITYFTTSDWHTGVAAEENEWRLFIRATKAPDRRPANEIRRQSQVYIPLTDDLSL